MSSMMRMGLGQHGYSDAVFGVWVDDGDSLVFVGEVLDCRLSEDVEGLT
jgi:hypothetical protein